MVKVKINGIPIDLPFEPYPAQTLTMSKILSCLATNTSGMIESPTGTGKSLSIICSVLGYKEHIRRGLPDVSVKKTESNAEPTEEIKENDFKIVICSRTHKQLDQLVSQLNTTKYRPRISILASRAQYCINPKLKNVADKNSACKELIKSNSCIYFTGKDRLAKRIGQRIFDIEELVKGGKKCAGCPYYASRKLNDDADIIFAPYNYLIDLKVRENTSLDLSKCVVIVDEAHNIDDVCRSSGSIELGYKMMEIIQNELIGAIKKSSFLGEIKGDFINLLELFKKLRENVEKTTSFDKSNFNGKLRVRKGKDIKIELDSIGITKEFLALYKNSLYSIQKDDDGKTLINMNTFNVLDALDQILSALHFTDCDVYSYVFHKENNDFATGKTRFSYNFWLMDSAYVFKPFINQVKSLVLLSGTLSPFSSFSSELGHKFEHEATAPHLISHDQVFISCIKKGHLKQDLMGTYKSSDNISYLDQLAKIIFDVVNKTKDYGGTLVFVPSYAFLENINKRVQLLKLENVFVEPKSGQSGEFEAVLKKYHNRVSIKKPVVLMCVYRGKASEGVDFKDSSARAVINIGIPYPSLHDPQIELKKEYNDKHKHFNGRRWYETQAFRAVNQAAGRAIRHKEDWGIILFLDSRYQDKRIQNQLSGWVCEFFKVYENYEDSLKSLNSFLDRRKKELEIKNSKNLLKNVK